MIEKAFINLVISCKFFCKMQSVLSRGNKSCNLVSIGGPSEKLLTKTQNWAQ